jgi:hypothetical protein
MPPIERRLDNLEKDIREINVALARGSDAHSRLGTLETNVSNINTHVGRIDERSLPASWSSVKWCAGIIGTVLAAFVGFYIVYIVPTQIANQVGPLQAQIKQFDDSSKNPGSDITKLNSRMDELNKKLDDSVKGLGGRIDQLLMSLAGNPRKLTSSLERALPKKQEEAKSGYPVARELLAHAEHKKVALKPEELKRLALPLLDLKYSDADAMGEAWATAKEFAAYRTFVNRLQFGEPKPQGQAAENYFNGGVLNLGSRSEWNDTVFVNCRINIETAQAKLILDNVRFINCDFRLLDETDAGKALVAAVLSSDGPTVSAPLLDHRVPVGKTSS